MDRAAIQVQIAAGGVPYAEVRPSIQPGDLIFLHHEFVEPWYRLSLYDKQIDLVQMFTGWAAHIAVLDRIVVNGRELVIAYESVVRKPRAVRLSVTAERGFFLLPMGVPISDAESDGWWAELGVNDYDKEGAVLAGLDRSPADEDALERRWCAKSVALQRRKSGLDLAPPRHAGDPGCYVPTAMAEVASRIAGREPIYVSMK